MNMDVVWRVVDRYGLKAFICLLLIASVTWGTTHWVASPGEQVSILWGMFQYAKRGSDPAAGNSIEPFHAAPVTAVKSSAPGDRPSDPDNIAPGPQDCDVFGTGTPFPSGLDVLKPGDSLSTAATVFPPPIGEYYDDGIYHATLSGVFAWVAYFAYDLAGSPEITHVRFQIANESDLTCLRQAALRAFGSDGVETSLAGTLTWRDLSGFRVELHQTYLWITKSSSKAP